MFIAGKRDSCPLLVGIKTGVATVENSMEVPQKLKDGTALWPSDSTFGYISEETQRTNSKEYMHPYVHCSVIYNSQDMEAAQVPINRWMDLKKAVVHIHNGVLLGHKKNEVLPFVTAWMDLGDIMLNEISWGKTNTIWFHLYVEYKEQYKWTNKTEANSWLPEGKGPGGIGEKCERIEKWRLVVTKHSLWYTLHPHVKYNIGNRVNNILITMHDVRWVLDISGWPLSKVYDCLTTMLYTWNEHKM